MPVLQGFGAAVFMFILAVSFCKAIDRVANK